MMSYRKKHKFSLLKYLAIILIFISLFIFIDLGAYHVVQADEGGKTQEEIMDETIREQLEKLDLQALQEYVDSLGNGSGKSIVERLLEYIHGKDFDYKSFGKEMLLILFSKVTQVFPAFACIMAIALLTGLVSMLQDGISHASSTAMVRLIAYAAALIPLVAVLAECVSSTFHGITTMQKQMEVIYPIMMTLMAACGNSVTVAVCRPAVAFFATGISNILCEIVLPLTLIIMAFSLVGNLSKTLKIGKFTVFFKSVNKWIIGVSISVFGLFFTLQGITAASYDGVMRRAAKYAIGNGIPIIGGFLSGGFDLAVAGSVLIKNSLGSMGIFLMISVLLEPLLLLVSVNILLRLTAAITQPMGDGEISSVLAETADNLRYCIACLFFVAFLFFLTILIMVCCTETMF